MMGLRPGLGGQVWNRIVGMLGGATLTLGWYYLFYYLLIISFEGDWD